MVLYQEMKLGGEVSLSLLFIYLFIYIFLFHLLFCILLLLAKADEATRANVIMGDVSDTLEILLAAGGDDHKMLTEEEQKDNDVSRLSYTEEDKTVIFIYKGAADPARRLCKFLQDKRNAFGYSTFEVQYCLQKTNAPTIIIFADVSHMSRTKDLRNRQKTVLLKKSGVTVGESIAKNYTEVETMAPCVQKYCKVYAEDLARRTGLSSKYLPPAMTMNVLLNPLFGLQSKIIGTGLLKRLQYARARSSTYHYHCLN